MPCGLFGEILYIAGDFLFALRLVDGSMFMGLVFSYVEIPLV